MSRELRRAREILTGPEPAPTQAVAAMRLFAEINRSAAPMLGLVALGTAGLALSLIGAGVVATWAAFIGCAVGLVYALPIAFLESVDTEKVAAAWRRKFVLTTAFCGSAWAYLVAALLRSPAPEAPAFAMLVMLLVSTVMSLLAATIPAAFVAGMLPMIVGVVLAYLSQSQSAALPAAAMAIGVAGYFLVGRPAPARGRRPPRLAPGGEGLADRRTRTGQAQFRRGEAEGRERESREVALPRHHEP